jgi:hypothetical protein
MWFFDVAWAAATAWPNSVFEFVRSREGKLWLGMVCRGEALTPLRTIELGACRDDVRWEDRGELLTGDISMIADSLLK